MSATVQEPKLCPILSLRQTSSLGGQPTASPCAGPRCMFFLPVSNDRGEVEGGACAVAVLAMEVNQMNKRDEVRLRMQQQNAAVTRGLGSVLTGLAKDGDHAPKEAP